MTLCLLNRSNIRISFGLVLSLLLFLPHVSAAQGGFTPLVGIPGVTEGNRTLADYVQALYLFSIGLAALLAFIKIVVAGVKYTLTDVVTAKGDAKEDIKGALIGLLIVAGAVLILESINPQLTRLDVLNLERPNIDSNTIQKTTPPPSTELVEVRGNDALRAEKEKCEGEDGLGGEFKKKDLGVDNATPIFETTCILPTKQTSVPNPTSEGTDNVQPTIDPSVFTSEPVEVEGEDNLNDKESQCESNGGIFTSEPLRINQKTALPVYSYECVRQ